MQFKVFLHICVVENILLCLYAGEGFVCLFVCFLHDATQELNQEPQQKIFKFSHQWDCEINYYFWKTNELLYECV